MDYRKENDEDIGPESWLMRDKWAFKYGHGADDPKKLSIHGVKKLLNRYNRIGQQRSTNLTYFLARV